MATKTALKTEPEVLLVDDNPADVDLACEIFGTCKRRFHVSSVSDGMQATSFLLRQGSYADSPVPDLLLLDLNLPKKNGWAVLKELKSDPKLSKIPVVVFTTSQADSDITGSYELGANCFVSKPGNLADFVAAVQSMADFWLGIASLP